MEYASPMFSAAAFPSLNTAKTTNNNENLIYFGSFPFGFPINPPYNPKVWSSPIHQVIETPPIKQPEVEELSIQVTPLGYQNNVMAPIPKRHTARMLVMSPQEYIANLPTSNTFSILEKMTNEYAQPSYV